MCSKGQEYEYIDPEGHQLCLRHVNNYPRKSLNYNSPIDIATLSLNKKVLSLNMLTHLNIEQVKLTPIIH